MRATRWPRLAVLAVTLVAVPSMVAADPCSNRAAADVFSHSETFGYTPPGGSLQQTRWDVSGCVDAVHGLVIGRTRFNPVATDAARAFQVFHDARVSEIFVPYHDGVNRFYDVSSFSNGLMALTATDCPPGLGTLVAGSRVCRELRDRGLAWKTDTGSRRGLELVVWGVLRASNYKYVVEWTFRDDGTIQGRVGPTGENLQSSHQVTHAHTVIWRLDFDIGGAQGDSVQVHTHRENYLLPFEAGQRASDTFAPIRTERGIAYDDRKFTMLKIQDATLKNFNEVRKPSSYLLIPQRIGTARHQEAFTHFDFWVTRHPGGTAKTQRTDELEARFLPDYVSNAESVNGADVVVWYSTTLHHIERDEDDHGPTQIVWVGFLALPFDVFDRSPLSELKSAE